jgi:hypothetical protein
VVNLLVTPEQAEMLSLASTTTTIQLVLRNPMDRQVAKTTGTAVALLFRGGSLPTDRQAAAAAPAGPAGTAGPAPAPRPRMEPVRRAEEPVVRKDPPFVMQIISGNQKREVTFQGANAEAKNNNGDAKAGPEVKPGEAK